MNIDNLMRSNIKNMVAYSSARHEFSGNASVFLDANENPFPSDHNRYPDPLQTKLKEKISGIKGVPVQNIFLGNGSDEAIDLLFRVCGEPGRNNVIICPPTYGMYEVCAAVNAIKVKKVPLTTSFQLDLPAIIKEIDDVTKIIFICSPNNPTGNSIDRKDIEVLLNNFEGLVVIDEAYINFANQPSFISKLSEFPNLVVLQTFSKAWGLAGLRLGMAFAAEPVINYLTKIKYPYNINSVTQQLALEALANISGINYQVKAIIEQREWLKNEITKLPFTEIVYPSEANFLLVKITDATKIYEYLCGKGIIVRNRSGCLRITIGTLNENKLLIKILQTYEQK